MIPSPLILLLLVPFSFFFPHALGFNEAVLPPNIFSHFPSVPPLPQLTKQSHPVHGEDANTSQSARGQSTEEVAALWESSFFSRLPDAEPGVVEGDPGERAMFLMVWMLIPAVVLLAALIRHKYPDIIHIYLGPILVSWLCLFAGIAIGFHRLFSHRSYEPTRLLKLIIQVSCP